MKSLEKEYRKMLQEELPDLWNRIEEGIPEREKKLFGMADRQGMPQREEASFCGQERTKNLLGEAPLRKSSWQKYALLAAACLCMVFVVPMLYGGAAGEQSCETSAPMEEAAFMEESAFARAEETADMAAAGAEEEGGILSGTEEEAPGMVDGTVVPGVEVRILEKVQMNYHTVYRAEVRNENDIFSAGEELEILAEEGQGETLAEGEAYCVDLIYDSRWEIPFRLFQNGQ